MCDCVIFFLSFFPAHWIQGLAAHVRLSPSDHSSEVRKSAVAPETQRADWSRIGTRPPNQRVVSRPHCTLYVAKWACYSSGLAVPDSGRNERPPCVCLFEAEKNPRAEATWQSPAHRHPPAHNGTAEEEQPAAKTAWCIGTLRYVHFLFWICCGQEWIAFVCVWVCGSVCVRQKVGLHHSHGKRVMTVPLIENHYKQL